MQIYTFSFLHDEENADTSKKLTKMQGSRIKKLFHVYVS